MKAIRSLIQCSEPSIKFFAFIILMSSAWTLKVNAADTVKLGLNWKAEPEFGGFYSAEADGIFAKNNLKVDIQEGGAGTPTVQMLVSGQIDFGIVSGEDLVIARSNKRDLVGVYAIYQKAPYIVMAHEGKGFNTLSDLMKSDTKLAVIQGSPMAVWLEQTFKPIKAKLVPYQGGISNFMADQNYAQQGFFASEPRLAAAKGLKTKVFKMAEEGFNPYVAVMAVRAQTLKDNPELVERMVRATRSGWENYFKNPASAHKTISKLNPAMDPETLKSMHPLEKQFIESEFTKKNGLGKMTTERWSEILKLLDGLKLLRSSVKPEDVYKDL